MLIGPRRENDFLTTLALKALEAVDCERLIPRNMHLLRKICFEMHGVAGSTDGTVRELVFFHGSSLTLSSWGMALKMSIVLSVLLLSRVPGEDSGLTFKNSSDVVQCMPDLGRNDSTPDGEVDDFDDREQYVVIHRAETRDEAQAIAEFLRAHFIEASTDEALYTDVVSFFPSTDSGASVFVLAADESRALRLLDQQRMQVFRAEKEKKSISPLLAGIVAVLLICSISLLTYAVNLQSENRRLSGLPEKAFKKSEKLSTEACDVFIYRSSLHRAFEGCDPTGAGFYTIVRYYSVDGGLTSVRFDLNRDGYYDVTESYNKSGDLTHRYEDRNGDGRYEFMVEYRNGRQIRYLDRNLDNFYDAHEVVP